MNQNQNPLVLQVLWRHDWFVQMDKYFITVQKLTLGTGEWFQGQGLLEVQG